MTFDFFLATIKVAVEFTGKHTNKQLKEYEASRRTALKLNNAEAY
jgi:very-short-patch-repair endonuclease